MTPAFPGVVNEGARVGAENARQKLREVPQRCLKCDPLLAAGAAALPVPP